MRKQPKKPVTKIQRKISSIRNCNFRSIKPSQLPISPVLLITTLKVRSGVKSIKKIKGKAGKPDKIELIVNVDPVNISHSNFIEIHLIYCLG